MLRADEVNREIKRIEENFYKWLQMSGLNYEEFLKSRNISDFQIKSGHDNGYNIVAIGSMSKGQFIQLGEQFVYSSGDENAFQDLALLLLYIVERLDSANKADPHFHSKADYFFNQMKVFIQSAENYMSK